MCQCSVLGVITAHAILGKAE
eukprot:COSAG06_NODE_13625_length_1237_cov_11.981287_1_plen_20_part_10